MKKPSATGSTPEGYVKDDIKFFLHFIGAMWFMPVQTGKGDRAVDFLVCWKGVYVAIEAKAPGEKATAKQAQYLKEVEEAGGVGMVIDSLDKLAYEWVTVCLSKSIAIPDICSMRGEPLRRAIGSPVRRTSRADSLTWERMSGSSSICPISNTSTPPASRSRRRSKP